MIAVRVNDLWQLGVRRRAVGWRRRVVVRAFVRRGCTRAEGVCERKCWGPPSNSFTNLGRSLRAARPGFWGCGFSGLTFGVSRGRKAVASVSGSIVNSAWRFVARAFGLRTAERCVTRLTGLPLVSPILASENRVENERNVVGTSAWVGDALKRAVLRSVHLCRMDLAMRDCRDRCDVRRRRNGDRWED
jgi:hypothetical protein